MSAKSWMTRMVGSAALTVAMCGVLFASEQSVAPDSAGSLAALTAEVRLLRLSVEKSAQTQAQIQAMTVYLSVQQSRLLQVSTRADALRKNLDAAIRETSHFTENVADAEKALAMPIPTSVQPSAQTAITAQREAELAQAKRDLARAASAEGELRNRESDAASAVQTELAHWTEMIARLEQATR